MLAEDPSFAWKLTYGQLNEDILISENMVFGDKTKELVEWPWSLHWIE